MQRILPSLIMWLFMALSLNAQDAVGPQVDEIETIAREFVSLLAKEDFSSATKAFDTLLSTSHHKTKSELFVATTFRRWSVISHLKTLSGSVVVHLTVKDLFELSHNRIWYFVPKSKCSVPVPCLICL